MLANGRPWVADTGAVRPRDVHALRNAYVQFRQIENRIRLMHGRSDSALAEDAAAQAELAQRLGIRQDLADVVRKHKARVHELYARLTTE